MRRKRHKGNKSPDWGDVAIVSVLRRAVTHEDMAKPKRGDMGGWQTAL